MKLVQSWLDDERLWPGHDAALEYCSVEARSQDDFDQMMAAFEVGYALALGIHLGYPPVEVEA